MIDVHAHFFPASILGEISPATGVAYEQEDRVLHFPSGPSRPIPGPLTDLGARSEALTRLGIERQVLSPWLDVCGDDLPPEQAAAWTRLYNDGMAAETDGRDGFSLFATLPVTDGEAAAAELARSVTELGFSGAAIPTQVGGRNLEDAGLEPLFEAAEDLGVPLFLHPYRVLGAERMRQNFLTNLCGNPFEVTLAAVTLFFADVPERYPRLKILLAHCGGTLPLIAGRVARGAQRAPGVGKNMDAPEEILGCYFYDTMIHDPAALGFCLSRVTPERCAVGSDMPFPMSVDDPGTHVRDALERVGLTESWDRVASGTALEILPGRV